MVLKTRQVRLQLQQPHLVFHPHQPLVNLHRRNPEQHSDPPTTRVRRCRIRQIPRCLVISQVLVQNQQLFHPRKVLQECVAQKIRLVLAHLIQGIVLLARYKFRDER